MTPLSIFTMGRRSGFVRGARPTVPKKSARGNAHMDECANPWSISMDECREEWKSRCSSMPVHNECLAFTRQEVARGRDTMDAAVLAYCARNHSNENCRCVALPSKFGRAIDTLTKLYGHPSCWYEACSSENMLTLPLAEGRKSCPLPSCRIRAKDIQEDGSFVRCPENFSKQLDEPFSLPRIAAHTEWLTTPVFV